MTSCYLLTGRQKNMEKNKKIFGTAAVSLMIVAMLSVGIPAYQQIQAGMSIDKLTEAHEECTACSDISEILKDYVATFEGLDDFDITEIPEFDEAQMADWVCSDDGMAAQQQILAMTEPIGCGLGMSYVYDSGYDEFSEAVDAYSYSDRISFDALPPGITVPSSEIKITIPSTSDKISSVPGHWELEITELELTYEQVDSQLSAIHEYYCSGITPDPDVISPTDWNLGNAIAFCAGAVGAFLGVPHATISLMVQSAWLRLCFNSMAYATLNQLLQDFEIVMSSVFIACVEHLTGQEYTG